MAEVRVGDNESIEAALRRFKREVLKAGIILEIKKRKKDEAKRKAVFNAGRRSAQQ